MRDDNDLTDVPGAREEYFDCILLSEIFIFGNKKQFANIHGLGLIVDDYPGYTMVSEQSEDTERQMIQNSCTK